MKTILLTFFLVLAYFLTFGEYAWAAPLFFGLAAAGLFVWLSWPALPMLLALIVRLWRRPAEKRAAPSGGTAAGEKDDGLTDPERRYAALLKDRRADPARGQAGGEAKR